MAAVRIASVGLETPLGRQLIAAPIGIGIAIVAAHLTRTDGTNTRDDDLYTTSAPRPPSATEAAAGFTAGSPSLTPAATAGAPTLLFKISTYSASTADSVCANYGAYYVSTQPSTVLVSTSASTQAGFTYPNICTVRSTYTPTNSTGNVTFSISNALGCPAGYGITGTSPNQICSLVTASAVPRPVDNACPIIRSGNSYSVDPVDPDCSNGQAPLVLTDATGQTISSSDTTGAKFSFHINTDGTSSVVSETPDTATNTTKRRTVTLGASANGTTPPVVTGVSDTTLSGTGAAITAPTGTASAADPALLASQQAATTSLQDIQAKEDAAAADRASAGTAAAAIPSSLPAAPWDISKLGLPTQSQFTLSAPNVALPSRLGCVPLHLPFGTYDVQVDVCDFVTTFTPIFDWLIVMMGVSSGVWQVFNRKT
jgi:hypothetical protein